MQKRQLVNASLLTLHSFIPCLALLDILQWNQVGGLPWHFLWRPGQLMLMILLFSILNFRKAKV